MANLALAVLASYAVYGLLKNKFSPFKQQLMLTAVIGFVILFEFSMIPYLSYSEPIPDIYEEIKNDESKFAVLPAPIGGTGDGLLLSAPVMLYHQIHHEKPIYGGFESRVDIEIMRNTQTYFLNMFHILGSKDDVIKQDLVTHGLSLFDHFDIKYVTLHKEILSYDKINQNTLSLEFLPETKQHMSEILGGDKPIHEDNHIIVYKIPKSNSLEPFLLLGSGWYIFEVLENARATMKSSEIMIVNPTNSEMNVTLNLVLTSIKNENVVTVFMNNEKLTSYDIPTESTYTQIENLTLKPGINTVVLENDKFVLVGKTKVSLKVESISITN
jgi:hypothetical protein